MLTDKIKDWIEQNCTIGLTKDSVVVVRMRDLLAQLEAWKSEEREMIESAYQSGHENTVCHISFDTPEMELDKTAEDYFNELKTGK